MPVVRERTAGARTGAAAPTTDDGRRPKDEDWHFTDFVPPAMHGQVGYLPVRLRVWPPDVIPTYPDAFRVTQGPIAGYWVAMDFG